MLKASLKARRGIIKYFNDCQGVDATRSMSNLIDTQRDYDKLGIVYSPEQLVKNKVTYALERDKAIKFGADVTNFPRTLKR